MFHVSENKTLKIFVPLAASSRRQTHFNRTLNCFEIGFNEREHIIVVAKAQSIAMSRREPGLNTVRQGQVHHLQKENVKLLAAVAPPMRPSRKELELNRVPDQM